MHKVLKSLLLAAITAIAAELASQIPKLFVAKKK